MTGRLFKRIISANISLAVCALALVTSCNKENTSSINPYDQTEIPEELLSKGVCNAFGSECKVAQMCYVPSLGEYYIDYFYGNDKEGYGSFGFIWDKATNDISLIYCNTGLIGGSDSIYFLKQDDYNYYMGTAAEKSYYDPENDLFIFNIMYTTYDINDQPFRSSSKITYQPTEKAD